MSSPSPPSSSDRRRQWLISHGFLSPSSGPSRRLGGLLPRVGVGSSSAHSADVDVRRDARAVPVLVARRGSVEVPRASRAVSLPSEEAHGHGAPPVSRSASTRVGRGDRAASPPRRRFFRARRRGRKKENLVDEKRREGARQVIKVVDRELPRRVLQGRAECNFDGTRWNEYRERIDGLAEDEGFMEYLTKPVGEKRKGEGREDFRETQQLAVNKLYPLAFIRLLEAQARFNGEGEDDDPADEAHRYDDLDGDEEARVFRTASSGIYDMGRFRTVGGQRNGDAGRGSDDLVRLLESRPKNHGRRVDRTVFLGRMSRQSRVASVPVC